MRICTIVLIATLSACASSTFTAIEPAGPGTESGFLRGQVQNDRGFHLPDLAVLAIARTHGGSRIGLTDKNGTFVINDIGPGSYRLLILRGSTVVLEQSLELPRAAMQSVHLAVPAWRGDDPSERTRPIVNRELVSSAAH
jgi:hypothetical protein